MTRPLHRTDGRLVSTAPSIAHLRVRIAQGATPRWLAEQSGISELAIRNVLSGSRDRLQASTEACLLAIPAPPPAMLDDAELLIDRLRTLSDRGWTMREIASRMGVTPSVLSPAHLRRGTSATLRKALHSTFNEIGSSIGPGPLAAPIPYLAEDVAPYSLRAIAAGTGLRLAVVERIANGLPVAGSAASKVQAWVVQQRRSALLAELSRKAA